MLLIYAILNEILKLLVFKVFHKKIDKNLIENSKILIKKYWKKISNENYLLILSEMMLKIMKIKIKHLKIIKKIEDDEIKKYIDQYLINREIGILILDIVQNILYDISESNLNSFSLSRFKKINRFFINFDLILFL